MIKDFLTFRFHLLKLRLKGASDDVINLEKGGYYLRKGVKLQIGQPFKTPIPHSNKTNTRYIKNLYFNFAENKIIANYSKKKIPGLTKQFQLEKTR